jgi:hypothetical protein
MANLTSCPLPFVSEADHPYTAGFRAGRFCGPVSAGLSCCLPCPLEQWFYTDEFERNRSIAYWFNVPGLVCQAFLLLSFAVLKERHSHVHYLSIGLCVALVSLEVGMAWVGRTRQADGMIAVLHCAVGDEAESMPRRGHAERSALRSLMRLEWRAA